MILALVFVPEHDVLIIAFRLKTHIISERSWEVKKVVDFL